MLSEIPQSWADFAEQFLAGCLGGRAEPYGGALSASTMKVEAEAPFTPGLRAALQAK